MLDDSARSILRYLAEDGSRNAASIAREMKKSKSFIARKLRSMRSEKVFSLKCMVNQDTMNLHTQGFIQVKCREKHKESIVEIERFLRETEGVFQCYKTIGPWDYLVKLWTRNNHEYQKILEHISNHKNITETSSLLTSATVFEDLFPPSVLRKIEE